MKICMVVYNSYETDSRVIRYAEALAQRGDQVYVLATRTPGQEKNAHIRGVHVIRLQQRSFDEKYRLVYLFRMVMFFIRAMFSLGFTATGVGCDVIHVHSIPDFLVFATWMAKLRGTKIILDIHDLVPELYASKFNGGRASLCRWLLLKVERLSAAFADHVIIANELWEKTLTARSVSSAKCTCFVNLPDPTRFRPELRNRNDDKFRILYPGTLNWHQGLDIAIRAFARIKDIVPEAEFHIYGRGPALQELADLARELHVEDRVLMRGSVPHSEIAAIMASADLAVVPKRKDSFGNEAFSTKVTEFMCAGVPVIASDTKIDRYYFNDSIVRFFRSGDDADLAAAMLSLIRDPAARKRLVRNAGAYVACNNWTIKKKEYLSLVDGLVDKKPAAIVA